MDRIASEELPENMGQDSECWTRAHAVTAEKLAVAREVLEEMRAGSDLRTAVEHHPLPGGGSVAKYVLLDEYHRLVAEEGWPEDRAVERTLRTKPIRTLSGVTTVTGLTKPYPCPGQCIFCPTDVRMPKSYLPDEPGAARALENGFDPYRQVSSRLATYEALGHPTDKIELLILGGTWSSYRSDYQRWFVKRCLDAMNGFEAATLEEAQLANETAAHRNVGLVVETRPDRIKPRELARLRSLGVTKVQLGAQSFDDRILELNGRGHTAAATLKATTLLRAAGFKIVLHWMPNLYGATLESDAEDFARMWQDYCPDEIKIYPTQLLEGTPLYDLYRQGRYVPYTTEELINLLADVKPSIPRYCRVNRIVRDIPSTHVVEGNRRTSLRQDVQAELARRGQSCGCIRCNELRDERVDPSELRLEDYVYEPAHAEEHFLHYLSPDDKIAGYLRLSLPRPLEEEDLPPLGFADLEDAALIREVHVYGQSLPIGVEAAGAAQHHGLGTRLLERAAQIARQAGYRRLAVITAIGTRRYYEARGFRRGELYMVREL